MLVHRRVTPSIKFPGIHLYTWVERGTVRVRCLAQEHNTMSPARTRALTTRSGVERTNHEATAPPTYKHLQPPIITLKQKIKPSTTTSKIYTTTHKGSNTISNKPQMSKISDTTICVHHLAKNSGSWE